MEVKIISYRKFPNAWELKTKIACTAVQIWTMSKYFHTEMYINGIRITSDTRYGVVIKHDTDWEYIKQYADIKTLEVDYNEDELISFIEENLGKKYDWKGIFLSQVLPLDKHDKNKYFCNEICGDVLLQTSAKNLLHKKTNNYNPGSFQELF